MDFDEFWVALYLELKRRSEFETLKKHQKFDVVIRDPQTITITPRSTMKPKNAGMGNLRLIWNIMKAYPRSERYINRKARYFEFYNISYASSLIDHVVGDEDME